MATHSCTGNPCTICGGSVTAGVDEEGPWICWNHPPPLTAEDLQNNPPSLLSPSTMLLSPSPNPPENPAVGDLWIDSTLGQTFEYHGDHWHAIQPAQSPPSSHNPFATVADLHRTEDILRAEMRAAVAAVQKGYQEQIEEVLKTWETVGFHRAKRMLEQMVSGEGSKEE